MPSITGCSNQTDASGTGMFSSLLFGGTPRSVTIHKNKSILKLAFSFSAFGKWLRNKPSHVFISFAHTHTHTCATQWSMIELAHCARIIFNANYIWCSRYFRWHQRQQKKNLHGNKVYMFMLMREKDLAIFVFAFVLATKAYIIRYNADAMHATRTNSFQNLSILLLASTIKYIYLSLACTFHVANNSPVSFSLAQFILAEHFARRKPDDALTLLQSTMYSPIRLSTMVRCTMQVGGCTNHGTQTHKYTGNAINDAICSSLEYMRRLPIIM